VTIKNNFRNGFAESVFFNKYAHNSDDTWPALARRVVEDVCGPDKQGRILMPKARREQLIQYITDFKFIPGGRYLYYAGRKAHFWNNCYLLRGEEDTREEWSALFWRASACLLTGGGIGTDYSIFRGAGSHLSRTGGRASGPLPLAMATNEIGRNVMQGGSRRSAIYASIDEAHPDARSFLQAKNWADKRISADGLTLAQAKEYDFNFNCPLDMTNVSLNWGDRWLALGEDRWKDPLFIENCEQAVSTGEPGFSFNFGAKARETLRNACTEVTSEDDSDVCNLGSINMGAVISLAEFTEIVGLASEFLVCGTLRADLPYEKVKQVREKNRRLGLGLMGMHEWLLKKGERYEVTQEMHTWLRVYELNSKAVADAFCDNLGISRPVAYRAIAPTGSIGILAGTTTGIEPLFTVAYKRRYLTNGTEWKYQYVIDSTAQGLIDLTGVDPNKIDTAYGLSHNYEQRMKFQYDVQRYVDMSISSTINLPSWGSEDNNPDTVLRFTQTLAKYAPGLRGFTAYPDGARGGQPLTEVPYAEAMGKTGVEHAEAIDVCAYTGKGGSCGV
jgi:ribonucleoside-diphosphate reductase alpha chain